MESGSWLSSIMAIDGNGCSAHRTGLRRDVLRAADRLDRLWRDRVRRADLDGEVFHQLRHTATSLLIGRGPSRRSPAIAVTGAVCSRTYAPMWASDEDRIRAGLDESFGVRGSDETVAVR
jgi:hypothetical protein